MEKKEEIGETCMDISESPELKKFKTITFLFHSVSNCWPLSLCQETSVRKITYLFTKFKWPKYKNRVKKSILHF